MKPEMTLGAWIHPSLEVLKWQYLLRLPGTYVFYPSTHLSTHIFPSQMNPRSSQLSALDMESKAGSPLFLSHSFFSDQALRTFSCSLIFFPPIQV